MSGESSVESGPKEDTLSSAKSELAHTLGEPTPLQHTHTPALHQLVENGDDSQLEAALPLLADAFRNKKDTQLMANKKLHYRLVQLFYQSYKAMDNHHGQQQKMLFILSLLAEAVRQDCRIRLPFSKKIVLSMLSFDEDILRECPIAMILVTLFENMAKQGRQMVRLGVAEQLKQGLLLLTGKADDLSALRISLRALLQLQAKAKISVLPAEFDQWLAEKVEFNFGSQAMTKMRSILCRSKAKKIETLASLTLSQLVSTK